ncbi:hypothetical protein R5H32_17865 [Defluviimonas sp. D31]|nr:hypothetical protein [Defluviimonas sp. D31]MDW4551227.1 hypothetical protein [Defluviimonas sp. D31]
MTNTQSNATTAVRRTAVLALDRLMVNLIGAAVRPGYFDAGA